MDTIFAEATPPGRGGVSIIRVSGPAAHEICEQIAGALPQDRVAAVRSLRDGGDLIDEALVIAFGESRSFTGEPVVEFQVHGAPVVVRRVEEALRRRGARLAGAGEFTKRALINGRLDLTRVQGLSDLLLAETESQRVLAMRNASGELGAVAAEWREALITAGALVMASLDFPDEDTPDEVSSEIGVIIGRVIGQLDEAIAGSASAERVRKGFLVAIIGPPNAGKSSLINRLSGRSIALVTDVPGTTRDSLEVHLDLGGLAVTLVDTAGLRETEDRVEGLGIARAEAVAQQADVRLHLSEDGRAVEKLWQPADLVVRTKADLGGPGVSSLTGAGIDALLTDLQNRLADMVAGGGLVSHDMQVGSLKGARTALEGTIGLAPELAAEGLAAAVHELEALVGKVDIEDYLDVVFSSFCIGK